MHLDIWLVKDSFDGLGDSSCGVFPNFRGLGKVNPLRKSATDVTSFEATSLQCASRLEISPSDPPWAVALSDLHQNLTTYCWSAVQQQKVPLLTIASWMIKGDASNFIVTSSTVVASATATEECCPSGFMCPRPALYPS